MTKLETWYRRLVHNQWADNYDIRFIIRSSVFIQMPKNAKSAIYWKDGDYYMVAMNHTLKWAQKYAETFPDIELFVNEKWASKGKAGHKKVGRPRKREKDPDICKDSTPQQIMRMILDRERKLA